MKIAILSALTVLAMPVLVQAQTVQAQTGPAQTGPAQASAPAPVTAPVLPPLTTPPADVVVLAGATVSPDCGGLYNLQGRAFCVSALLTETGALAEAYIADLEAKGWLVASGEANRVVFVRRKSDGACDGLQMQAFYNSSVAPTATTLGYLGFGVVPGNVCAAQPAPTTPPPATPPAGGL